VLPRAGEHAGVASMGKAGKGTGSFGESLGPARSQAQTGAVWMPNIVQQAVGVRRWQQQLAYEQTTLIIRQTACSSRLAFGRHALLGLQHCSGKRGSHHSLSQRLGAAAGLREAPHQLLSSAQRR
jgi:hypothetical protein